MKELDYTTDAFGREAVAFIERHKAEPWFLYLAFNAVHTPMQATDDRLAKFADIADKQRRTYDAMMLAMDEAIGRVRKKARRRRPGARTRWSCSSATTAARPCPARPSTARATTRCAARKRTTLEGGIRVPFVVSWPGHVKPGVYDQPAIQLDLHATALAAAGRGRCKPEWKLDGVNLLPFLSGEKTGTPHDALYWRFGQQMAIRAGDYKLVRYDSNADTLTGARNQPVTAAKLYHLSDDIGETKDLAAAMPDKVKELQAKWDAWNATLVAPLWGGGQTDKDGREGGTPAKKRKKAKAGP